MRELQLDLPLAESAPGRFLLWIISAATCLSVLAMTVVTAADATLQRARLQPVTLTVAVPAEVQPTVVSELLARLQRMKGVAFTEQVSEKELSKLVEPWMGGAESDVILPIPRLIDVTFDPGAAPDPRELQNRLSVLAPEIMVDEADPADRRVVHNARLLRTLGLLAVVLFLGLGLLGAVRLTQVSLAQQRQALDLLRQMGARDGYIAGQFEQFALSHGLRGSFIGFALGIAVLLIIHEVSRRYQVAPFSDLSLGFLDWLLLAAVPVVLVLLLLIVVRTTVRHLLARQG